MGFTKAGALVYDELEPLNTKGTQMKKRELKMDLENARGEVVRCRESIRLLREALRRRDLEKVTLREDLQGSQEKAKELSNELAALRAEASVLEDDLINQKEIILSIDKAISCLEFPENLTRWGKIQHMVEALRRQRDEIDRLKAAWNDEQWGPSQLKDIDRAMSRVEFPQKLTRHGKVTFIVSEMNRLCDRVLLLEVRVYEEMDRAKDATEKCTHFMGQIANLKTENDRQRDEIKRLEERPGIPAGVVAGMYRDLVMAIPEEFFQEGNDSPPNAVEAIKRLVKKASTAGDGDSLATRLAAAEAKLKECEAQLCEVDQALSRRTAVEGLSRADAIYKACAEAGRVPKLQHEVERLQTMLADEHLAHANSATLNSLATSLAAKNKDLSAELKECEGVLAASRYREAAAETKVQGLEKHTRNLQEVLKRSEENFSAVCRKKSEVEARLREVLVEREGVQPALRLLEELENRNRVLSENNDLLRERLRDAGFEVVTPIEPFNDEKSKG